MTAAPFAESDIVRIAVAIVDELEARSRRRRKRVARATQCQAQARSGKRCRAKVWDGHASGMCVQHRPPDSQ